LCMELEKNGNERAVWIAQNLIEVGKMTLEEIAKACGLSIDKVRELADKKSA